jgi:hypothetical protein
MQIHGGRGYTKDTLEVAQLETVINGSVGPQLHQEAALQSLANASPLLLETGALESLSLSGGHG